MKTMLVLSLAMALGCGGAVEATDGAASAEWRCELVTSPGASLTCDAISTDGEAVACDCPSTCSFRGVAGSCVAP